MDATTISLFFVVVFLALALWARGLIKSNRSDLIAGCCVFAAACFLAGSTGIVPLLGVALIAFGVDTFLAGGISRQAHLLDRRSRLTLSIGLVLLGLMFLLVV